MRRTGVRIAMAGVGVAVVTVYLAAAAFSFWALSVLLRASVDVPTTVALVVVTALAFTYLSYRYSTARLLSNLDAVEVPARDAPELYRRIESLCAEMNVDRPRVLVARLDEPNAFAVGGRDVVVVDRHLFRMLTADELEALLAHELAHLESHDALVGTMAYSTLRAGATVAVVVLLPLILAMTGVAKAVGWIRGRPADWPRTVAGRLQGRIVRSVAGVLSGATLLFLAHSRRREYAADDRAAEVTGDPLALARALAKIDRASRGPWELLSMLRVTGQDEAAWERLLSTHPPMDERIDRLLDRAGTDRAGRSGVRIPVR